MLFRSIDTHFRELLDSEVLQSRLRILQDIEAFTPLAFNKEAFIPYSFEWVQQHVLLMTETDIKDMKAQTDKELLEVKKLGTLPSQLGLMPDNTPIWQLEEPPPEPATPKSK